MGKLPVGVLCAGLPVAAAPGGRYTSGLPSWPGFSESVKWAIESGGTFAGWFALCGYWLSTYMCFGVSDLTATDAVRVSLPPWFVTASVQVVSAFGYATRLPPDATAAGASDPSCSVAVPANFQERMT